MDFIKVIDRTTEKEEIEEIYGKRALAFLYSKNMVARFFLFFIARIPLFSILYGDLQKTHFSKRKIEPFVKKFKIDKSEFEKKLSQFESFNDFFIRKLKKEKRPIVSDEKVCAMPADARYLVFEDLSKLDDFYIKNQKFNLLSFLKSKSLYEQYKNGSMAIARLCPVDYHRFHFIADGYASKPKLINGYLYSVNPIALKKNLSILWENKRSLTEIDTKAFGKVIYAEIGATNVGSIHQTYIYDGFCKKGEEKGYFALGGSSIVLLFEKNRIKFSSDLLKNSEKGLETKALFGQELGRAIEK